MLGCLPSPNRPFSWGSGHVGRRPWPLPSPFERWELVGVHRTIKVADAGQLITSWLLLVFASLSGCSSGPDPDPEKFPSEALMKPSRAELCLLQRTWWHSGDLWPQRHAQGRLRHHEACGSPPKGGPWACKWKRHQAFSFNRTASPNSALLIEGAEMHSCSLEGRQALNSPNSTTSRMSRLRQ